MKKTKFDIQGMTCSSCSTHVENAVKKLNGIKSVNVNLLSNNMLVQYDENILNISEIINEVEKAGYGAKLQDSHQKKEESNNKNELNNMKKRLIISICFLIPLMYISMHSMLNKWIGVPIPEFISNIFDGTNNAIFLAFTEFLLVLPIAYVNRSYYIIGFKRLLKRTPNMDSLIAIGSSSAIFYGIFAIYMMAYGIGHENLNLIHKYSMELYFESGGMILTLITFGKYLEAKSKSKTTDAIEKLVKLAPKDAVILRDGKEIVIETENIMQQDIVIIKPGASIPVDGIVVEGNSFIDEASITGESIPIEKNIGDNVISGTVNKNGYLKIKATKVGNDTTLAQIIKLVEEASSSKAPIAELADKVSKIFVPTVIIIALISTIIWLINGQTFEFALSIGISVLVISCPCALGLATPVAIMVGTGKGAQNGILIKSAESFELLHKIDTVVLDKTGTITNGKPVVTDIVSKIDKKELIRVAGSIEKNSEHPIAQAIIEKSNELDIHLNDTIDFISVTGKGIKARINNLQYFIGNKKFLEENNIDSKEFNNNVEEFLKQGKTIIYVADKNDIIGIIAISDTIKETSKQALKELKNRKLETIMLTGDNKIVAEEIAKTLEIDRAISELLPQEKEREIEKLQKQGKIVAFVGDGINDSPSITKADVGIAIGSGTDIAIDAADIILIKNNLEDVIYAVDLSKAVVRNIKMNLFWAFFYNIIGIPIAAGVFYTMLGLKLSPMIGATAMSFSSVCVVLNALRLKRFKPRFLNRDMEGKEMSENTKTILIEGMQCNHCKMTVEKALSAIEDVANVKVSLEDKKAVINLNGEIEDSKITQVIQEAGFIVKEIR